MRKRKSGECQVWKAWEKQAPETANAEGKKNLKRGAQNVERQKCAG
jgi:hypothetical protein